ncbi:hypothetical protein CK203_105523 [Vitis vinifera]|uniref:Reverse transcriptase RNase H-like domain-containing protein n=1 Tax=Vitis vinifera TaxID=29760 RepID=A0A438FGK8_VITVI|nr:hypothetical protein CK203_105523 [Vitis vinifera]
MKLNPSKCAFGVSAWQILGFMVSQRGIEVSPDQIKAVMKTPPPRSKKELQRLTGKLVALGQWAISAVLFRCPHPRKEPIYYSAAQKFHPYFQAHPVVAVTDQHLRNILHKPDLIGRMLQWAIELSEFGIEFQPRLSMKGQVMADFMLEYSEGLANARNRVKKSGGLCELMEPHDHQGPEWLLLQSPTGNIWSKPSG